MKKNDQDFERAVRMSLRGKQVPILVLDTRWHSLFEKGEKTSDMIALENKINSLLKKQGRLVNDIKDLKKAKKKLMEGIVAGMDDTSNRANKKKNSQQRLLLETTERIQMESDELMELPSMIKKYNEELMVLGVKFCFERLKDADGIIRELTQDIKELKEELEDKTTYKAELGEKIDHSYALMHGLFGHDVMNLFDKGKFR